MGYNGNNRKLRPDVFPKRGVKLGKSDIGTIGALLLLPIWAVFVIIEFYIDNADDIKEFTTSVDKFTKRIRRAIIKKRPLILILMILLNCLLYILAHYLIEETILFWEFGILLEIINVCLSFILISNCKIFLLLLILILIFVFPKLLV